MKSVSQLITDVFSNPTAPYREGWVLEFIKSELDRLNIPFIQDNWGNIIAGVSNARSLKTARRVALVAHTDHPGFHIIKKKSGNTYIARWYGGHPPKMKGAAVAVYNSHHSAKKISGKILNNPDKKKNFLIKIPSGGAFIDRDSFGAFDFPGCKFTGGIVRTRAADDLAGAVIILATLSRLSKKAMRNFVGIFTVAEETGFKGTLGILRNKTLGKHISAISLEASRQLDGARIGKGPVIRLGDKKTIFDNNITSLLDFAAQQLAKKSGLKFQKRVMSGGTCEATAFNVFGIPCGGIAVPLGNYHNQRPNGKPGAEFININDVETAVKLCVRFYENFAKKINPLKDFSTLLMKELKSSEIHFKRKITYVPRI